MLSKKIQFHCHEDLTEDDEMCPIPAKKDIPLWFKNVSRHTPDNQTIKGCIPVRDMITGGYLLRLPQTIDIKFNVENPETKQKDILMRFGTYMQTMPHVKIDEYNLNTNCAQHPIHQLGGSGMYVERNKGHAFPKILNPYLIKTPPGYSTLFIPPQHRSRDYFEILPAIVDTDSFDQRINFPITFCGHKKETFEATIQKGTPYVQVIPFKRDSWKMEISAIDTNYLKKSTIRYMTNLLNIYKKLNWTKKIWN